MYQVLALPEALCDCGSHNGGGAAWAHARCREISGCVLRADTIRDTAINHDRIYLEMDVFGKKEKPCAVWFSVDLGQNNHP